MLIRHRGLYYKHVTFVNGVSSVVNKFEALLIDDARVITYDHHVFIVQAVWNNNRADNKVIWEKVGHYRNDLDNFDTNPNERQHQGTCFFL